MSMAAVLAAAMSATAVVFFLGVGGPGRRIAAGILWTASGLAAGGLVERVAADGLRIPADLALMGGIVMATAGLVAARRGRTVVVEPAVAALATVAFLFAAVLGAKPGEPIGLRHPILVLHILFVGTAAATLVFGALFAAFYLLKERALRAHARSRILPRLETLDRTQQNALSAGFVLMTIGMSFGVVVMARSDTAAASPLLVGTTWATWLSLAAVLWLRRRRGWSGHHMALSALAMVTILVLVVAVSFLGGPLRHGGA